MPGKRSKEASLERSIKKQNNDNAKSRKITDTAVALCEALFGADVLTERQRDDIVAGLSATAGLEPKPEEEPPATSAESQGASPK